MVFTLEMSKEEMINRILASEAEVDSMKIKNGNDLTSEDWLKLGQASGRLSNIPLYIDDTPGLKENELSS